MQKELSDLLVFIELYSQENPSNTFSNATDPLRNILTEIITLEIKSRFKTEVQITYLIFNCNFTAIAI